MSTERSHLDDLHDIGPFDKISEEEIYDNLMSVAPGWHDIDLARYKFIEPRGTIPSCVTGEELAELNLKCTEFGKVNSILVPLVWLTNRMQELGGTVPPEIEQSLCNASDHHDSSTDHVSTAWIDAVNCYNGTLKIVAELKQHCVDEQGEPFPYCAEVYKLKAAAKEAGAADISELLDTLSANELKQPTNYEDDESIAMDELTGKRQVEQEVDSEVDEDIDDEEELDDAPRSSFQTRLSARDEANSDDDEDDDDVVEEEVDLGPDAYGDEDDEEFCTGDAVREEVEAGQVTDPNNRYVIED